MPAAFAPAKINLTLRVRGRRPDGYHDLESLVVFADIGDRLRFAPGEPLSLTVAGETASEAGPPADNLVLKAARRLMAECPGLTAGRFDLDKSLPVAAGLGGGSSDAAAALRLLTQANPAILTPDDPRLMKAARATGADVPVCLEARPRVMRGTGDILSPPLVLPKVSAVLINPRVSAPTAAVFAAYSATPHDGETAADPATALAGRATSQDHMPTVDDLIAALAQSRNDLEAPATLLHPIIAEVLAALRALPGCRLARMSGSGATCFALFDTDAEAAEAARTLAARAPRWWVRAVSLG
jgi:4-diphosphocytidyl-2-C-methyl-D-erythritol kinase